MPAALALARALHLTPREALFLLRESRALPAELDANTAQALATSLNAAGVDATPIDVPPSSSRCASHPSLTGESPCDDCRTLVCPLCAPLCRSCTARRATAARWKRLRVVVLLTVLFAVASWGVWKQRSLNRRNAWLRPLRVSLVLVTTHTLTNDELLTWHDGAKSLERWFADEAERLGFRFEQPFSIQLAPNVVNENAPSPPETSGEWVNDSRAALGLRNQLEALATRGGGSESDLRIVIALRERGSSAHRVEGVGEAGGSVGLVEGTAGDVKLTLELLAIAHELLHLVGAQDAYDAEGHAIAPRGLAEPELGTSQRSAEVMVGEVPTGPREGRLPTSLSEVRIGEVTAREIGWR